MLNPCLRNRYNEAALLLRLMYKTSAQKKATLPQLETTITSKQGRTERPQKSLSDHKRLIEYVKANALKKQTQVTIDTVKKIEVKFCDPPYLAREAPFPSYDELNINLKGYDFTVLETCHNFIARLCRSLDVDVKDVYAMPARSFKVNYNSMLII